MANIQILDTPNVNSATIDIVFIHGLNPTNTTDHARRTWTHKNGTFWPQSLLSPEIPFARIMIFTYNAAVLNGAANASIATHANSLLDRLKNKRGEEGKHRPLLFVAHSMGGLVVKQALIGATLNTNYCCIKASTYGLVFFAVPHRGSNKAGLGDFAANVCAALTGEPKNSLVEQLQRNSILNEISTDQFSNQMNDYEILTYYETKMTKLTIRRRKLIGRINVFPQITNMYVVDSVSAKLGIGRETPLDLDRNHSEICKFSGASDPAYDAVGPNIKSMAESARAHQVRCEHDQRGNSELQASRQVSYANDIAGAVPSHIALPYRKTTINVPERCDPFVGRENLVREISEWWKQQEGPRQRKLLLSGLGGAGKTELSLSIIQNLEPHQFVVWLRANEWEAFQDDFLKSALFLKGELLRFDAAQASSRGLGPPQLHYSNNDATSLTPILEVWIKSARNKSSRILVILDDLDGLDVDHHLTMSRMFASNTLDLIYTARDPLLAQKDMIWEAGDFEVPALQEVYAANLLLECVEGRRRRRHDTKNVESTLQAVSGADNTVVGEVAKKLGELPAAIIIGSHYVKDHLSSSAVSKSLERLLHDWDNRQILQFRRDAYKYGNTILESFEVSKARLKRNTHGKMGIDLYGYSLTVLQLLSALRLESFMRDDLDNICTSLSEYLRSRPESPLAVHLRFLGNNISTMNRCVTELIRVSLLSRPNADDRIIVNRLIMACALLSPNSISPDEQSGLRDVAKHLRSRADFGDYCDTAMDTGQHP